MKYGDTLINKRSSAGGTVARMLGGSPPSTGDIESAWNGIMGKAEYDPSGYRLDQTQANVERNMGVESRMGQELLGGQLQAQIRGLGPTVAGQQQKFGMAEAMRNAGTQAANARGVSRGMALRESMYAGQDAQAQANRDASLMRASEQLGAMGQYGQLASQQRAGDIQSREVSLGAEKANQQAELQRQGYQTQLANENAARKQKGFGSVLNAAGGVMGALSDIRAKEDISPAPMSFAERLTGQRQADDAELQRRADVESNARIEAMLASSNAGYGAQQAGVQSAAAQPAPVAEASGGGSGGGMSGAMGGGLQSLGKGLMSDRRSKDNVAPVSQRLMRLESRPNEFSEYDGERWNPYPDLEPVQYDDEGNAINSGRMMSDEKSKERIRFLEGELYGRPRREVDQQNPYRPDYLSEAERSVENGFDSRANLRGVRPYEYRYKPAYAELIAEQAAGNAPTEARPAVAAEAYGEARIPRVGVMAQELEKTPGGRKVVSSTPVGKVLDMKRSVAFTMANQADMNRRLSRLEGKRNDS
jgi:hypothetical protein